MPKPAAPYRADQVGSLLRPAELKEARAAHAEGRIDRAGLREVEDRCIRAVVRRQEAAGLKAVTDGEFRRAWWHFDFLRSEEHTSELQSLMRISYAVFCLKKKNTTRTV